MGKRKAHMGWGGVNSQGDGSLTWSDTTSVRKQTCKCEGGDLMEGSRDQTMSLRERESSVSVHPVRGRNRQAWFILRVYK